MRELANSEVRDEMQPAPVVGTPLDAKQSFVAARKRTAAFEASKQRNDVTTTRLEACAIVPAHRDAPGRARLAPVELARNERRIRVGIRDQLLLRRPREPCETSEFRPTPGRDRLRKLPGEVAEEEE